MNYSGKDIDVFIATYNRSGFLKQSVLSVLEQSVKDLKITVIDNASSDDTQSVMEDLQKNFKNVFYIRNKKNFGGVYSYLKAAQTADKKLMMVFHDDDILHPKYIETALRYFNKIPNLNILSSDCAPSYCVSCENWEEPDPKAVFCKDYKEFASYLYYEGDFAYPPVIYRTENVKKLVFQRELFGKIDDKPRCVEICKGGAAVILTDKRFLRYRLHKGQDSADVQTGPFYDEIANYNKYFKNILYTGVFDRDYWLFSLRNVDWFFTFYSKNKTLAKNFNDLISKAYKDNSAAALTYLCSFFAAGHLFKGARSCLKKLIKPKRKLLFL